MRKMAGDMLSQDEIDALLRGETLDYVQEDKTTIDVNDYLNEMEQDAIGEIGNISLGSSATALSTLLNHKVEITTPTVSIIDNSKIEDEFPHPYVAIQVKYTVGFSGINILVIKQSDANIIADLMLGGNGINPATKMDEIQLSAVQEAMNQMMGSAATSLSSIFNKRVDISPPSIELLNVLEGEGTSTINHESLIVKVAFRLKVGNLIDSEIMQLMPIDFVKNLVGDLMHVDEEIDNHEEASIPTPSTESVNTTQQNVPNDLPFSNEQQVEQHSEIRQPMENHQVQTASFMEFKEEPIAATETKNLDMLLDIPLEVTVELGSTTKTVKDILELGTGSVIELDKLAGEPVDILVNSRLIAKGEVVVIDENFGVRVTDIVSKRDRINKLK